MIKPYSGQSDVLIVIPVHNSIELTLVCIQSLADSGQSMHHLLVVDNGSTDRTSVIIKEKFPQVEVITQKNKGFAAAVNVGLSISLRRGFKYTWLLNNDATLFEGAITNLTDFMESPANHRVGACSPLIYQSEHEIHFAGGKLERRNWGIEHIRDVELGASIMRNDPYSTFLTGCALFIRNEAVADVGLFNEKFFMYWEDCDFCIRLANSGWLMRIVPSVKVLHEPSSSSGGEGNPFAVYYVTRNCFLMCRRHSQGWRDRSRATLRTLLGQCPAPAVLKAKHLNAVEHARLKGIVDGIRGLFGKRKIYMSESATRTVALALWFIVSLSKSLLSLRRVS